MSRSEAAARPDLSAAEQALSDCYEQLVAVLRTHGDDLDPFARRGAIKAVAALWHVAEGLDLDPEPLYDLGI